MIGDEDDRRYLSTSWLSSPHLQTILLNHLVKTPKIIYKRELFRCSEGGTVALDWLMNFDDTSYQVNGSKLVSKVVPVVIVVPGLTGHSESPADRVYTAGWTDDLREVVSHLHRSQPDTPLFAIGTSIGANILVKYLGEDGVNVPFVGAAAISNPWDLLMGDRFMARRLVQRFYNRVLANDCRNVAKLHPDVYARIGDWEGIEKVVHAYQML